MFKEPQKEKLVLDVLCDVCGKPVATAKEKSDVTRFLLEESRCRCIHPPPEQTVLTGGLNEGSKSTSPVAILNKGSSSEPPVNWKEKFAFALENIPAHYQVLSVLGVGGMGAVFKCLDTKKHRICAIKTLRPQFVNNANVIARFKQEAKAASKLHHQHLAEIYDFGIGSKNAPYMVMECIEGETLAQYLSLGRPMPVSEALDLFIQIGDVLQFAHSKGIVHRDIKPSNIIVEYLGNDERRVRLLDFGIAKTLFLEGTVSQGLTQTGEIFGSPPYMSPEQCEGRPQDAQSDIYAFGCVMFECLVGHTPFQSRNPIRMILDHLEKPAPLVTESTTAFVPKALSDIVNQCLSKDLHTRYKTVSELIKELEACKQWMPVAEKYHEPLPKSQKIVDYAGETMFHFSQNDATTKVIQERLERAQKNHAKKAKAVNQDDEFFVLPEPAPDAQPQPVKSISDRPRGMSDDMRVKVPMLLICLVVAVHAAIHWSQQPVTAPLPPIKEPLPSQLPQPVATAQEPIEVPKAVYSLAKSYIKFGRYDLALPLLEYCEETLVSMPRSGLDAEVEAAVSTCRDNLGNPEEAKNTRDPMEERTKPEIDNTPSRLAK